MLGTLATTDMESLRSGLRRLRDDPTLSPEGRDDLTLIDRLVWLLDRTWTCSVPHLVADNERLQVLLDELIPLVPACDVSSVPSAAKDDSEGSIGHPLHHEALAARNQHLRAMLSRVITAAWAERTGVAPLVVARARVALREGLETRPW